MAPISESAFDVIRGFLHRHCKADHNLDCDGPTEREEAKAAAIADTLPEHLYGEADPATCTHTERLIFHHEDPWGGEETEVWCPDCLSTLERDITPVARYFQCATCQATTPDDGWQPEGWAHTMDGRDLCDTCRTDI